MSPSRRRRAALLVALSLAISAGACNLITGEHDRFLRNDVDGSLLGDSGAGTIPNPSGDGAPSDATAPVVDAAPDVFVIGNVWTSPNAAKWTYVVDSGTQIYATGPAAPGNDDHAVLFPNPQPDIPSDDYTVEARVRSISPLTPSFPEFGILARVDEMHLDNDAGVVSLLSSAYGGGTNTWIGTMGPPPWSPANLGTAVAAHPSGGDRRFVFVLTVRGNNVSGRMWDITGPDPGTDQVFYLSPRKTGRGVGFYVYAPNVPVPNVWLEDMRVTVP